MARGGRRPGAGRPFGAKDKVPRGKNGFDELKTMVREAEAAEYLFTSDGKEFTGTGRELLKQIYHNQRLPLKYRMYAATQ